MVRRIPADYQHGWLTPRCESTLFLPYPTPQLASPIPSTSRHPISSRQPFIPCHCHLCTIRPFQCQSRVRACSFTVILTRACTVMSWGRRNLLFILKGLGSGSSDTCCHHDTCVKFDKSFRISSLSGHGGNWEGQTEMAE